MLPLGMPITIAGKLAVMLKADAGYRDEAIQEAIDVSLPAIHPVRRQFVEEGMERRSMTLAAPPVAP